MTTNNNGGSPSHETAAQIKPEPSESTPQLTREDVCSRLQALGFKHTNAVPPYGFSNIPARGMKPDDEGARVIWCPTGQSVHWHEKATGEQGAIYAANEEASRMFLQACRERHQAYSDSFHANALSLKPIEARLNTKEPQGSSLQIQAKLIRIAKATWTRASTTGTHAVIERAGLTTLHNARLRKDSDSLLIPMFIHGEGIVNLLSICPNGEQRFINQARVKDTYCIIGGLDQATRVLICEDWISGATLAELHGMPVVVAFSSDNLNSVCKTVRKLSPTAEIIQSSARRFTQ